MRGRPRDPAIPASRGPCGTRASRLAPHPSASTDTGTMGTDTTARARGGAPREARRPLLTPFHALLTAFFLVVPAAAVCGAPPEAPNPPARPAAPPAPEVRVQGYRI